MVVKKGQDKNDLLLRIQNGDARLLESLYDEHRGAFIVWSVQRYQCSDDAAAEIYQKAFTILYFNIRNGRLTQLTSSLKTYLFSIGKNLFRESFRDKHNKVLQLEDHSPVKENVDNEVLDAYKASHQKNLVRKLLDKIGDPCATLLRLMFIKGYSTEAVVHEMGYSDERVVRKRKSLCLKSLREMAQEIKKVR